MKEEIGTYKEDKSLDLFHTKNIIVCQICFRIMKMFSKYTTSQSLSDHLSDNHGIDPHRHFREHYKCYTPSTK